MGHLFQTVQVHLIKWLVLLACGDPLDDQVPKLLKCGLGLDATCIGHGKGSYIESREQANSGEPPSVAAIVIEYNT
jgi:hypothetical protein